MKNPTMLVLAILAGLFITATTNAQDNERKSTITFEQFVEKVSGVSIPGFSARPFFDQNLSDEYQAAYVQGSDVLIITLEARHNPPVWLKTPYRLDGKDAEYVLLETMGGMGTLAIDLPETYSVLSIASNKIKDKATLEQIARQTGLMQVAPITVEWPARVPREYRVEGVLMEASEGPDITTGVFSYQVIVTFAMSEQLIESLLQLREKCVENGIEEVFYRFSEGIILDFPISITEKGLEEARRFYEETSKISFTYYFP